MKIVDDEVSEQCCLSKKIWVIAFSTIPEYNILVLILTIYKIPILYKRVFNFLNQS